MGNSPSTSKSVTPSASSTHNAQEGPKHTKRDNKHPIPVHNQRVAAPPEQSLAQAQGSTISNRNKALQPHTIASLSASSSSPSSNTNSNSAAKPKPAEPFPHEPSKPVAVPDVASTRAHQPNDDDGLGDEETLPLGSGQDMSFISRPPRLPLPIEEEVHTPGSPIVAAQDAADVPADDTEGLDSNELMRQASGLSNATVEDEDNTELLVDKTRPTVPTRLEWLRGGERVYVTGTIFNWNRKQRLHPVASRPGALATVVNLYPGTHHIRFLVDNNMETSPDLPTTVDFGNNLVNYIEVNADDLPAQARASAGVGLEPADKGDEELNAEESQAARSRRRERAIFPVNTFYGEVPRYLLDYDQPEDSDAYQYSMAITDKLSSPPSLPGFLAKPILNAAVLMKDDNSVLNMPNHTVLNHLATSSIKNQVLAVSATTRYQHKCVTTIIYKPTKAET